MADIGTVAGEIGNLFVGVGEDIYGKFSQVDKAQLTAYANNVAQLTLQLAQETDPAKKAKIVDNLNTYANAARLMVAKYEIMAATELEMAAVAALSIAVQALIKILIAAL
jgi:hypothetical protein